MRLSGPVAALNKKIWILTFAICSTNAAQWPVAKDHDTDLPPADEYNLKLKV